jgi:threonine dehydratase
MLERAPQQRNQIEPVSIAELWETIRPYSAAAAISVHGYLPDGRPLQAAFATRLPSGSFKERGALAKMWELQAQGHREAVAYSAGNHAAGCALGARATEMTVKIFAPHYVPDIKIQNTERLGGDAVDVEKTDAEFEGTRDIALAYALKHGLPVIEPFDDLTIARGQGTVAHELLLHEPGIDHLLVPAGGGGLAAGCIEAIRQAHAHAKVYGVKLTSEKELCEGAFVAELGGVAQQTIAQNPDLWGGMLYVDPADVGRMVAYEDAVRAEQYEAMGLAAYDELPEATALLGAAAAHRYFEQLQGSVATIVTGSNADHSKLDTLHRRYLDTNDVITTQPLHVASGYQFRRAA